MDIGTLEPPSANPVRPGQALRQKAEELEGVFLHVMLSSAFAGIGEDDAFASQASDTWRGMQIEQLAGEIAAQGGIGLADQLFAELVRLQEVNLAV